MQGGVLELLEREFGNVEIAGSVDLDLMVQPDIDLYTRLEPSEAHKLLGLVPKLAIQLERQGFALAKTALHNEYILPDPNFPTTPGLYGGFAFVGGQTLRQWKMDFWGWNSAHYKQRLASHESLHERLKDADRELVLRLKEAPGYGSAFFSMDVYAFVLAGAGNLQDLERFMQRRSSRT